MTTLSESGQKIVDTFTRQITQLVERCEFLETKLATTTSAFETEKEDMLKEWKNQVSDTRHERNVIREELIDRNARLDVVEGELSNFRADHGALTRAYNSQTAELESLRRAAGAFGKQVEAVLNKNPDTEQADKNINRVDELVALLAIEHAKPDIAPTKLLG